MKRAFFASFALIVVVSWLWPRGGGAAGTARFVVKHAFGSDIDFSFAVDGRKLEGPFHADAGKTTTFTIPSGKLVWTPAACSLSPEPERTGRLDLGAGDAANAECWQSDREGMCCQVKTIDLAPRRRR